MNDKNFIPAYYKAHGLEARWVALTMLGAILIEKKSLAELKQNRSHYFSSLLPEQKARTLSILEGVLRNLSMLDSIINVYVNKKPSIKILNVLRVAAAEIFVDNIASHAVVDSAVRLTKNDRKLSKYCGFINAVCRNIANRANDDNIIWKPMISANLLKVFEEIYGIEVSQKFSASQARRPPIDITVKSDNLIAKYAKILDAQILASGSLRLRNKKRVSGLEGFEKGDWWVQDFSASLPARLFGDVKNSRVLDVCAAPGGKTMQLISYGADVTAIEISRKRADRLQSNLARTKLNATIIVDDIMCYWPTEKFDFILVDPPCTSTGTIRRNFDLQYLNPTKRLPFLVKKQKEILEKCMELLNKSGKLIFCTCSLLPQEGEKLVSEVIDKYKGWIQVPIKLENIGIDRKWLDTSGGLRLRPDYWEEIGGMDGFYIAVIMRRSSDP